MEEVEAVDFRKVTKVVKVVAKVVGPAKEAGASCQQKDASSSSTVQVSPLRPHGDSNGLPVVGAAGAHGHHHPEGRHQASATPSLATLQALEKADLQVMVGQQMQTVHMEGKTDIRTILK